MVNENIIRFFASILLPGQLTYILGRAIVDGNLDIVKYLIEQWHCDVNIKIKGFSALHWATSAKRLEIVKYFVKQCHCKVDVKDEEEATALHLASQQKRCSGIVKCLVEKGHCNVNIQANNGKTALHCASSEGRLGIVKYLIEKCHCEVDTEGELRDTSLHYASQKGHLKEGGMSH